jgi:hypothetical protein
VAEVVVVVPVLDRPHRVVPLIASHLDSLEQVAVRLLFVASPGDAAEIAKLQLVGADFLIAEWPPGRADWARKMNFAYKQTTERWVFTGADDLCFCPGWADRALDCAASAGAAVVGTQDLANARVLRGEHATHNLVARWYADQLGTVDGPRSVVSEVYEHNYVDDELVETAKARGLWTFCDDAEVPHLHPNTDPTVHRDATYELGQRHFQQDALLFRQRQSRFRALRRG